MESSISTPSPQPIKRQRRNPKRAKKNQNIYFTKETQDAILRWQESTNERERQRIFTKEIYGPFQEISRSLINVYNYADPNEREEVIADCTSMLYETLSKFDATKGYKAFSYFSVVARNWLLSRKKKVRKENRKKVNYNSINPLCEESDLTPDDLMALQQHQMQESLEDHITHAQFSESVEELWYQMQSRVVEGNSLGKNEELVLDACKEITDNAEELDLQTRAAMRLYIQEFTGLSKQELAKAIRNLKDVYQDSRDSVEGLTDYWNN